MVGKPVIKIPLAEMSKLERKEHFAKAPSKWVVGLFRKTRCFFMELESVDRVRHGVVAQIKHKTRYRTVACRIRKMTWPLKFERRGVSYDFEFSSYVWNPLFGRFAGKESLTYVGLFQLMDVVSEAIQWCEDDIEANGLELSATSKQLLYEIPRYHRLRNFRTAKAQGRWESLPKKDVTADSENTVSELVIDSDGKLVDQK